MASLQKKEGIGIQKLRRQVAFDRLLARLFQKKSGAKATAVVGPYVILEGLSSEIRRLTF